MRSFLYLLLLDQPSPTGTAERNWVIAPGNALNMRGNTVIVRGNSSGGRGNAPNVRGKWIIARGKWRGGRENRPRAGDSNCAADGLKFPAAGTNLRREGSERVTADFRFDVRMTPDVVLVS